MSRDDMYGERACVLLLPCLCMVLRNSIFRSFGPCLPLVSCWNLLLLGVVLDLFGLLHNRSGLPRVDSLVCGGTLKLVSLFLRYLVEEFESFPWFVVRWVLILHLAIVQLVSCSSCRLITRVCMFECFGG